MSKSRYSTEFKDEVPLIYISECIDKIRNNKGELYAMVFGNNLNAQLS